MESKKRARIRNAMLRYLELAYNPIEVNEDWVIIYDGSNKEIALVKLDLGQEGKSFADIDRESFRKEFESVLVEAIKEFESVLVEAIDHVEPDITVRPDAVQICVVDRDKAIIKHYKNVLGRRD